MVSRLRRLLAFVEQARPYRGPLTQCVDLIQHKLRINTSPRDYYAYEFYRPGKSWAEKSLYLGAMGSRYWPFENNPLKSERLFTYKVIQKAMLTGLGLPTPPLIAAVGPYYPIADRASLAAVLTGRRRAFVAKPDGSLGGNAVLVLRPSGDKLVAADATYTADSLWDHFLAQSDRGFLLEEYARNHRVLHEMYPGSLNTLRIITIRTLDGVWRIAKTYLKVGAGGSQVDNSSHGGLVVGLDQDGTIVRPGFPRTGEIEEKHPDTGVQMQGVAVPLFDEALQLALRASREFGFMGTIGWDVAVTDDGPLLIEANAYWQFDRGQRFLGAFLTPEIVAGLRPRRPFQPWDKTHMHPGYRSRYAGGWLQRWHAARRARG